MNLILYSKNSGADREILEYLESKTGMNVHAAHSKVDVIKLFGSLNNILKLIIVNMAIPSDLGLIKFITENYPETKIIVYAGSVIKESIDVIRNSKITVLDDNFDNLKKVHEIINNDARISNKS
jgi:hypothetical protein